MAKKSQRPSVKLRSYESASRILNEYQESRPYLQSLIERFIPNGTLIVDSADFAYLKHCGRTIKGVAQRMLDSSDLMKNINALSSASEETQRELLDERVCMQWEGQKLSGNHNAYIARQYKMAKNQ